jgi:hypothetical protein
MRSEGGGEHYLRRVVRQMTTDCPTYVFTTSTVPATGPRGARATPLPAQRLVIPPLSKRIDIALKGMAASFARPSRAVRPPKPRSGLRYRRKGVDGEDFGRATIGLARIGSDHAWTSSVLVHRKVDPSIHMRCRITASLRATATLARLRPRRLATSSPQRLSAEKRVTRESKTFAAS